MIYEVISIIVIIFVCVGIVTQIIIPACKGSFLFPFFRPRAQLEDKLIELNQQESDLDLMIKINQQNVQLAKKIIQSTEKDTENE